jgi:hypothetical protein
MAVGTFDLVGNAVENIFNGTIDLDTDTFAWVLLSATHTFSDAHAAWSEISANEIADGDYAEVALAGGVVTQITAGMKFDCNDVDFGNAVTIEAKWLYLIKGTAGALNGTDLIVGGMDLDDTSGSATKASTAGDFDIAINASGLFDATVT